MVTDGLSEAAYTRLVTVRIRMRSKRYAGVRVNA